jgi:hypothetical protein
MTRLTPNQLFLENLEGKLPEGAWGYMSKETAYKWLKQTTGQDFGYDAKAWRVWIRKNVKGDNRV